MIVDLLLYLFYGVIWLITSPLRLLSDVTANNTILNGFTQAQDSLGLLYGLIPNTITTLLTCLGLIVTFEVAYWGYKGFMWVLRKLPGIN